MRPNKPIIHVDGKNIYKGKKGTRINDSIKVGAISRGLIDVSLFLIRASFSSLLDRKPVPDNNE